MKKITVLALAILGLGIMLYFAACTIVERERDITPIDESALDRPVEYVGSKRCGECHDRIYHTWRGTKHPHMIAEVNEATVLGDFVRSNKLELVDKRDGQKKIVAKMSERNGKYFISTFLDRNEMEEFEISYAVGGIWKQQYLTKFSNGAFQLLPVQWNVKTREWVDYHGLKDRTPDSESYWSSRARTWQKNCAKCHTTGFKENFKDGKYESAWTDNGVGCEACHGPGSHHVNIAVLQKLDTIFNPGTFYDDRRANQICGSCHTRGKSTDGQYEYPATYTVGAELDFHYDEITPETAEKRFWPDGSSQGNHQQWVDFQKSVMYSKGVKCWSCHDPHKPAAGNYASLRLAGNTLCQSCHGQPAGKGAFTHSIHDNGNCTACHLPKTVKSATRGDIAAHTFYAIPPTLTMKLGNGDAKKQPNSCSLCHYHKNTPTEALTIEYEYSHKDTETFSTAALAVND